MSVINKIDIILEAEDMKNHANSIIDQYEKQKRKMVKKSGGGAIDALNMIEQYAKKNNLKAKDLEKAVKKKAKERKVHMNL